MNWKHLRKILSVGYSADGFEVSDIVCWLRYICSVLNQEAGIPQFKESAIDTTSRSVTNHHASWAQAFGTGVGGRLSRHGGGALVCVTRFCEQNWQINSKRKTGFPGLSASTQRLPVVYECWGE